MYRQYLLYQDLACWYGGDVVRVRGPGLTPGLQLDYE